MTVENLAPGRELDAAVSGKMGKPAIYHYPENWPYCNCKNLMFQTDESDSGWDEVPYFSTDIAAAWQVIEYAGKLGYYFQISPTPAECYCTVYQQEGDSSFHVCSIHAKTAAHAICLAFLAISENG